jgi:hypothetical protein
VTERSEKSEESEKSEKSERSAKNDVTSVITPSHHGTTYNRITTLK